MKYLFVAEKPSVTKAVNACYLAHKNEVQKALGDIDFVSLRGHACKNCEPNDYEMWDKPWKDVVYPMIPEEWKIKANDDAYSRKVLSEIKQRIQYYDAVIVGTDSDQEGYGIYYLIENYLEITNMPALRFMEGSLTDKEVLNSLLNMRDFHTDPIHKHFTDSFVLRSRADWLFGMNGSRLLSNKMGRTMNVGRVKAPVIKLIYDNSMAIENFKPEKYYQLVSIYDDEFCAVYSDEKDHPIKFKSVEEINDMDIPKTGVITSIEKNKVSTPCPMLYDLAAIQSEAGQTYNMTPSEILNTIQSLYEKHKVISYPRTECRYVSEEKAKEFPQMLKQMLVFDELKSYVEKITDADIERVLQNKKIVNTKEVEKESHDALLPTDITPDLSKFTEKERLLCMLIYKRLLAQFLPELVEEKTKIHISHGDYKFYTTGKIVLNNGWRALYGEQKGKSLPFLEKNQSIESKEFIPSEKITSPPKRYTQASLLNAMENFWRFIEDKELRAVLKDSKGIGRPSTRDVIISEIIKNGYVTDKKGLYITDIGKSYIEALKGIDIVSPIFTALIDRDIKKIQRGEKTFDEVYNETLQKLKNCCSQLSSLKEMKIMSRHRCQICGELFEESRYYLVCQECNVKIPKYVCGKTLDDSVIDKILSGKPTARYTFTKKDGSKFTARLVLVDNKELKFDLSSGFVCPYCGKDMRVNKGGVFCECGLKIFNPCYGKRLTDKEIHYLLKNKKLPKTNGFISKSSGKPYSAALIIDDNEKIIKLEFD